jgi:hypothetical protein
VTIDHCTLIVEYGNGMLLSFLLSIFENYGVLNARYNEIDRRFAPGVCIDIRASKPERVEREARHRR